MTHQFEKLLEILGSSVFGHEFKGINNDECEKILQLAKEQGVLPLVYPVVSRSGLYINPKWEMLFIQTIAINEKKQYCLKNILENMEKAGIECCVLKGSAVADLYFMSECRVSGDIDLYIKPDDEKAAMKLLSSMGMTVTARSEGSHHFEARDKNGGLIEVHITLYSHDFDAIVLKNKFSTQHPFVNIETKNKMRLKTLSVEDALYFLTAHLIKHFVREGCGIRQITDLLAYVNAYKEKIDFDEYFEILTELKFDTFIKNILGIGVIYFSLELPVYSTDYAEKLLSDVEKGGNFGFSEDERRGFYENFLRRRSVLSEAEFRGNRGKKRRKSILKSVFLPGRGHLIKKGYTYAQKSVLLYPVAYIHRLIDVMLLLKSKKRKISDFKYKEADNETIRDRIELMRSLEIL